MNDEIFATIDSETLKAIAGMSSFADAIQPVATAFLSEITRAGAAFPSEDMLGVVVGLASSVNTLLGSSLAVQSSLNPLGNIFPDEPQFQGIFESSISDFRSILSVDNFDYLADFTGLAMVFPDENMLSAAVNLVSAFNQQTFSEGFSDMLGFQGIFESLIPNFQAILGIENLDDLFAQQISTEAGCLRKYEWFLVPGLPREFDDDLSFLLEQECSQIQVDEFYCSWFKEDNYQRLSELIDSWNSPYFSTFKSAIWESFEAHKSKLYYPSVAALLPIFDAISVKFANVINTVQRTKGALGAFQRMEENHTGNKIDGAILAQVSGLVQKCVFEHTDKLLHKPALNRHLVAHPEDVSFGTEANSIRCFLYLQTLHYIIEEFKWV